jgi:hypothetical protein
MAVRAIEDIMIRSGAESERVVTRIAYILDDEPEVRDFIAQIATGGWLFDTLFWRCDVV